MTLPWVSRAVHEAVCAERDRLAAELQTERQRYHEIACKSRRVTGERDPFPPAVTEYVNGFASGVVRDQLKREIRIARKNGRPWKDIEAGITVEEPE